MGHSLQLLDNVYIQQLKRQQVLRTKRAMLGDLQRMLEPGFVSRGPAQATELHTFLDSVQIHAAPQSGEIKKSEAGTRCPNNQAAGKREKAVGVKVNPKSRNAEATKGKLWGSPRVSFRCREETFRDLLPLLIFLATVGRQISDSLSTVCPYTTFSSTG